MIILCCNNTNFDKISISDIANVIIAFANIVLACYIFFYQIRKDKQNEIKQNDKEQKDRIAVLDLQEQNIRLLWFKEIIVQPHLESIKSFYKNIHSIEEMLCHTQISDEIKDEVLRFIKNECSIFRKSFIDILRTVNHEVYIDVKNNIDQLLDHLTRKLLDVGLNLNDKPTFEREIGSRISYSHNDLISKLYNYKGK